MYGILVLLITTSIATSTSTGVVDTETKIVISFCHIYLNWGSSCQDDNCNAYCRKFKGKFAKGNCEMMDGAVKCHCQWVC
ncbi:unnamed protein product [Lactuca virosa]|uniref:Knottin scorpion toxin-like domain-containing protein n=1 Tax=Lactuca virosa TaxID=75947 RepID=A0AAU9NVX5_9ASTR|nr:unnamed protein product [Lactuca virosa]